MIPFLVQLAITAIWSYSLYYDIYVLTHLYVNSWSEKLVMLTNLNFLVQTINAWTCFFVFVLPKVGLLKRMRDYFFFTIIFPVALCTSGMYWGLYAINPDLVMPQYLFALIPSWINQVTHTFPVISVILQPIISKHNVPNSRVKRIITTLIGSFFYFSIIVYIKVAYGFWLYPIFSVLSTEYIIVLFIGASALMVALQFLSISICTKIQTYKRSHSKEA
uniref:Pr6Pr family membrane protein n=1 Tax=Rhabditophanes sp. KR3021 TaxID=114890 RepID=A0AC35TQ95_9BILA